MMKARFSSISVLAAVTGASVAFLGCSAGSNSQFSGSVPGQLLEDKPSSSADQTASKSTYEAIQAQRRADNALLAAALAGLENSIAELRKRDNELADKIASVDKTLGERIAGLETRVGALEEQDEKFAAILEAVRGDITKLEKEDMKLAQSIADNLKLINGLRSDLDQHLEEFNSKVAEIIKNDPDLKKRFDAADNELKKAQATYKAELEAAKTKAEQDLAAATAAHQLALRQAKDGYLVDLENASKQYQIALDELRSKTSAIDKKFTDAARKFRQDIRKLGEADVEIRRSIATLESDLDAANRKSEERHTAALDAIKALGDHVAETYATKAALETVAAAQRTLRSAFLLLNGVPDKAASDKLLAEDPALSAATSAIALTLKNAKQDHEKIKRYRSDFNKFKSTTEAALANAMAKISAGNAELELLQQLTGELAKTSILIATGEKNVSEALTKAIEKVKSGEMSQQDLETLQGEFAASIQERQSYESQTQAQLDAIADRLSIVEVKASRALSLAKTAARDIRTMKGDITKLYANDAELQKNIDTLSSRLTTEIERINNKVSTMLDGRTPEQFATTFQNTVTLAARTNTQLKNLKDEFGARLKTLEEFKTQAAGDIAALQVFENIMTTEMPRAISAIQDFTAQHWAAVAKVIQTLAPFQAAGNSPASQIAVAFKRMALQLDPVCGFNPNADFPSLAGEDYFAILGKRYLEAIVYEDSAAVRSNPIFFSIPRIASRDSLLGMSLAPLFETRFNITKPDGSIDEAKRIAVQKCEAGINTWVADVLFGELGNGFRAELLANGTSLKEILQTMVGIARQAESPLAIITQHISGQLPNAVRTLQAEVAHHAQQIIDLQKKTAALDQQLNDQNGMAQKLAAAQVAIENLTQTDVALKLTDSQLRARIDGVKSEMNQTFQSIKADIGKIGDEFNRFRREQVATNSDLYVMISALATKAGLSDIAADALKKATKVTVPSVPPTLPNNGSTTGLGMAGAGIDLMTNPMQGLTFKCSKYWTDAAVGNADCINARSIPNDKEPTVLYNLESALVVASAGAPKAELYSGVSKATGSNQSNTWKKDMEINLQGSVFKYSDTQQTAPVSFITGTWVNGVWMVPLAKVITPYLTSQIRDVALMLVSYGVNGAELNRINMFVRMYSPIVMNFAGNAAVPTNDFAKSGVRFDLDGNGSPEQVGWVNARSSAGFLALDRNGNGKIDSGRELFGEATLLSSGKKASDGYVALKEMDSNNDGFVDQKDKMFGKLSVWFDRNLNGSTESGELVSLKDAKVTRIAVNATEVKDSGKRAQHVFENDHKLEAKFWGPEACGTEGCSSFDIFFSQSIEVSKK